MEGEGRPGVTRCEPSLSVVVVSGVSVNVNVQVEGCTIRIDSRDKLYL